MPCLLQSGTEGFTLLRTLAAREWEDSELQLSFVLELADASASLAFRSKECLRWLFTLALTEMKRTDLSDDLLKAWLSLSSSAAKQLWEEGGFKEVLRAATQALPQKSTLQSKAVQCALLCSCAQQPDARNTILKHAMSFSQDLNASLRLCIASQLPLLLAADPSHQAAQESVLHEVCFSYQYPLIGFCEPVVQVQMGTSASAKQACAPVYLSTICRHLS